MDICMIESTKIDKILSDCAPLWSHRRSIIVRSKSSSSHAFFKSVSAKLLKKLGLDLT